MSPRKAKQNSANVKDFSEAQTVRDHQEANGHSIASSVREISIIETMESFLEENGASEVDPKVLRVLAETLTKRFQDTSPGTLQDVTMDQSYGTGYRSQPSCQGNVSPSSHGRSVREFEEQMAALHKENFNLKLKLFFLEESVPGYKQTQANNSDPVLKQLIEKKVENEMLRKDLQDNQSLLRDSMHTIEELEKMIQIKTMECKTQIDELNHKINFYEMERELQQESNQLSGLNESKEASRKLEQAEEQINDLTAALQRSEEQIEDFQSQISKLDNILLERDETIAQLHEELAQLKSENNDLKSAKANKSEQLDRIEKQKLRQEIQDLRIQMADKICMLDETEDKLKQKTQVYEKALKTIQKLMLNVGSQQKEIAKLKNQSKNMSNTTLPLKVSGLSGLETLESSVFIKSMSDGETQPTQNEALILELKRQLEEAQQEAESANRWRKECADVCGVLTNRLEELAGFLNSLLKQKDVLCIVAADRRKAMRKAVDRSLDLSKSLNQTLSISGISITDISLAHLSNLSQILGFEDDEEQPTFNSHMDASRLSFEMTKNEKQLLKSSPSEKKKSNEMKKERKTLPLLVAGQENQSESEAWSEPDRLVSMARIGLDEHSASLSKDLSSKKADTSESECDPLNHSRNNSKTRIQEKVALLEQAIAEKDERILEIQCQLVEADNRLKKENLRVLEMTNRIEALEQQNDELEQELQQHLEAKESQLNQSTLLYQIEEKSTELENLKHELDEVKLKHEIALTCANEEFREKLAAQKEELEAIQEKNLKDLELQHKAKLDRDYIALNQYEEIKAQLLELQRQYIEAQRTIDNLTDNEHELKQTLLDYEMEGRSLKKQLDESTLQASKAIMERTKAFNDKLQFEAQVEDLKMQISAFETERDLLQDHVQRLEEQIASLEARKVQNVIHEANHGEASASGYTSEEVPNAFSDTSAINGSNKCKLTHQAVKRQNNSSSPDLGIESDAGRLSGTEGKNSLKTLAVKKEDSFRQPTTASKEDLEGADENIDPMDNKTDAGTNTSLNAGASSAGSTSIQHDCAQVEQENLELRRKLSRTKKAFEDTYEKLRVANQRKAQIERDIKNQILKTHNVLRNVRTNMENEL